MTEHSIAVGELTLGYSRWGTAGGPVVVLLSGLGMPPLVWESSGLIERLVAARYDVICPIYRGSAPSSTTAPPYSIRGHCADVAVVLEGLGVEGPVRLVGVSLGGFIAQEFVTTHPERVSSAVLIACLVPSPVLVAVDEMELELHDRLGEVPPSVLALEMLLTTFPPSVVCNPEHAGGWLELFATDTSRFSGPDGLAGNLAASRDWSTDTSRREALGTIECPVLSIGFEFDVFFPATTSETAARLLPNGRHITIGGAGHGGIITHGDQITEQVAEFFLPASDTR